MVDITLIIAIWGAVLSTAAIVWNIIRDTGDKGKLDVVFYIGNIFGGVEPSDKDFIFFKVTNVGRKPITVTQVGGGLKVKHFFMPSPNIPKLLNPTEYITAQGEDFSIFDNDLKFLGAWDSTGKIWKVNKKVQQHWTDVYMKELKNKNDKLKK